MTAQRAAGLALLAAVLFVATPASAEDYPTRSIMAVVPFAAGSASDVVARILFDRMSRSLGQPIIIENRPGAGGNTGTAAAAKATPDGYTLLGGSTGPIAANLTLYKKLDYDPQHDLEMVSPFAGFTIIVTVSSKIPVENLQELIAYAKAHPGELNYGSVGIGSSQHLAGEYFSQLTGVKITHVPYRNIGQYLPDLMAGQVPLGFQWLPNVSAAFANHSAKALAVASDTRLEALPDTPTSKEAGLPQYIASGWFSLMVPRGTPDAIVARLNNEVKAALADPEVRAKFTQQGAQPMYLPVDQSKEFVAHEIKKYHDIIENAGIPRIE